MKMPTMYFVGDSSLNNAIDWGLPLDRGRFWHWPHLAYVSDLTIERMGESGNRFFFAGGHLYELVDYEPWYAVFVVRRCTSIGVMQSWLWFTLQAVEDAKPYILRWLARRGLCAFPRRWNRWTWDLLLWRR